MDVRPFIIYTDSMLQNLEAVVEEKLNAWMKVWGLRSNSIFIESINPVENLLDNCMNKLACQYFGEGGKWLLFVKEQSFFEVIGSYLFNDNATILRKKYQKESIVGGIVNEMLDDLSGRFILDAIFTPSDRVTVAAEECLPAYAVQPGSGCVEISLKFDDNQVLLYFSWPVVESLINSVNVENGSNNNVVHGKEALGNQILQGEILLGEAELSLDALSSLQIGDVIRLDKSLHDAAEILFNNSQISCYGFLGRKNENLAVRINSIAEKNEAEAL